MNDPSHAVIAIASPAGDLRLRPEQDADNDFRFALFCQSRAAELALMPIEPVAHEQLMRIQYRGQTMTYRTNFPGARFDIIEREGSAIGRLITDRAGHHIAIVDWAIMPEMRGRGIGTAIMQSLMEEARQTNREIRLKVASNNAAALRLYLRLGFAEVAEMPLYTELAWNADGSRDR
ncbi:GNAT family N-acetyltransferase [Bradyrhizobium guangzhouense]|uniref:N-acetyltransferase n=1 Tax=Bradyrhizobium guangzhouense TaxID=1325095 RepID=A0AAE5X050_9BRAD|nr:GNAT family N-acetyltransferase [Bradyrhizobium guangzhouense]QAU46351.1 N-acetyltransferase [Bradyrhizobium guangzhouense]